MPGRPIYIVPLGVIFRDKLQTIFPVGRESPHSTSVALPPSSPLLVNHELVRSPEEDLRWKVLAQFATEGALDGEGLKGELPDAGWNIAAALLAGHHEGLLISGHLKHASMIGER